ncbi:MAG: hypothetical protein HQL67_11670 [Magnetococcales bacterium]|nr:hypothetical protein [Magnetococcales bacterium]
MSEQLRNFAANLLEHSGAVIERIEPSGLEVLSPPEVRDVLSLPELARLGFAPELPLNAERVGLESNWLDRFQELLGRRGQWARLVLNPGYAPPSNPERTLEHAMSLQNATYRMQLATPARTRYLILIFRYTALSEEKREGIVRIGFNLSNGATMDGWLEELWPTLFTRETVTPFQDTTGLPIESSMPEIWAARKLHDILQRALSARVEHRLERFVQGLNRRQERDLERLHDYFSDMRREILQRMAKGARGAGAEPQEEQTLQQTRLESIEREYRNKVVDLRQKYAMNVETKFIQALLLEMPVYRLAFLIKRRKGERRFHLDWNPMVRKLETPPCEYSFTWNTERMVCDDNLHLVSPEAHAGCPNCNKLFCRACHADKCPRCGKRHTL